MNVSESVFLSVNTRLTASMYKPAGDVASSTIVILTGDGASGSASSSWPPLVDRLIKEHFSVYLFDFHSQGASEGDRRELSLSRGRQNLLDALQHLREQYPGLASRLAFVASSFGASVLLATPEALAQASSIVFKSPAVDLAAAYECDHGSLTALRAWRDSGVSPTTGLPYRAYEEALLAPRLNDVRVDCPVLIVHGTADEIVHISQGWRLANTIGPLAEMLELHGVKHGYKEPGAAGAFIEAATAHFKLWFRGVL